MRNLSSLWRKSASLIVLVKNGGSSGQHFNYKVISCKRTPAISHVPNSVVFPGGVVAKSDESKEWLEHFKTFNVTEQHLETLTNIAGKRPPIFQSMNESIPREISIRITAIRETFEELGILLCCKKEKLNPVSSSYASFVEDFDRHEWQKIVHNDPKKFLTLCQELNVIPDLWSLYEWNVWLTPTNFRKTRFEAAFFLAALDTVPDIIPEKNEVEDVWLDYPNEILDLFERKKIFLFPPQIYELSRLNNIKNLDELVDFSRKRQKLGLTVFFPLIFRCKDGTLFVLPGDDLYPDEPNFVDESHDVDRFKNETLEEVRLKTKNLHRREFFKRGQNFFCNIKPMNGHLMPIAYPTAASKL